MLGLATQIEMAVMANKQANPIHLRPIVKCNDLNSGNVTYQQREIESLTEIVASPVFTLPSWISSTDMTVQQQT